MIQADDKIDFEAMATDTLELSDVHTEIKISVLGHVEKGGTLSRYTAFLITVEDKDGELQVHRRFSQFYALREVMIERWPGCFVPAIPDKKMIGNNEEVFKMNRERFLDNFVKKVAGLDHLYNSQQFQYFLKSKEENVTNVATIQKWAKPSYDEIIIRYQKNFGELAGKELDSTHTAKIINFETFLKTSQSFLTGYKDKAKKIALSRAALDKKMPVIFSKVLPVYEEVCLSEYNNSDPEMMIYTNSENAKLQQHGQIVDTICKKNPYWLVYDLIKMQHRDGEAMLQAMAYARAMEAKRDGMQAKSRQNQKDIQSVAGGSSSIKTIFYKGTKEEVKSKLQNENEELRREKENLATLCDITSALLAYITIDKYVQTKKKYYFKVMKALSCYEINFIQNMQDIWTSWLILTRKHLHAETKKQKEEEYQKQEVENENDI